MSNVVWGPERGWHDGPEVTVGLDSAGRIDVGRLSHLSSAEVRREVENAVVISDKCAVTIASFYQSPGTVGRYMAELASTGKVDSEDLLDDIGRSLAMAEAQADGDDLTEARAELAALEVWLHGQD